MSLLYNMEEALQMERMRDNENSFYDVFEKCSAKEMIDYKRQIGIPIITISIDEVKRSLNK